jgi:hypothetical protein
VLYLAATLLVFSFRSVRRMETELPDYQAVPEVV